jgi:hypothetical protein
MSQITWKNIAAPEFKGALYGMNRAAETLQGAFDPLDKLMKERKALDEQNFQTGIKNNDRAIAAKLQGIGTLGELNQAEEGEMSLANMSDQYGAMFSQDALKTGLNERRGALRQEVFGSGLQAANQAADEGRDLAAGIPVMEQHLRDSGMQPEAIAQYMDKYKQDNAYRNDIYNKDRDAATRDFKSKIGKITNLEELDAARKEAAGMGNQIHQDKVSGFLDKKLDDTRTEIAHNNAQTNFTNTQKALLEQLTPTQQLEAKKLALQNMEAVQTKNDEYSHTIAGLQANRDQARGWDDLTQEYITKNIQSGKDITDMLPKKFHNDKVRGILNNKINELTPLIGKDEAAVLVYQAAREAGRDKWFSSDGKINKSIFNTSMTLHKERYENSVPIQNSITELNSERKQVIRQLTTQASTDAIDASIAAIDKNKGQAPKPRSGFSTDSPAESKLIQTQQEVEDRNRQLDMEQQAARAEEEKRNQHNLMAELNKVQSPPPPPTQNQKIGIGNVGPLKLPVVETPEGLRVQDLGGVLRELTQTELQEFGPQGIEHKFKRLMQGAGQTQVYTPPM